MHTLLLQRPMLEESPPLAPLHQYELDYEHALEDFAQ
jgi:hypothetical protein